MKDNRASKKRATRLKVSRLLSRRYHQTTTKREQQLLTKNEIAREVEDITGIKPGLTKSVIDALATLAAEEVQAGNDFSLPGLVRISYRYTAPRKKGASYKKGETYVGFGGIEQTAEADSKARTAKVKLVATPATPLKAHMPKAKDATGTSAFLKSKAGKRVVARKR